MSRLAPERPNSRSRIMGTAENFVAFIMLGLFVIVVFSILLKRYIYISITKHGIKIRIRPSKEGG